MFHVLHTELGRTAARLNHTLRHEQQRIAWPKGEQSWLIGDVSEKTQGYASLLQHMRAFGIAEDGWYLAGIAVGHDAESEVETSEERGSKADAAGCL